MVFNKKDVINFIKRLRVTLDRYYKKHYNINAPDFKYLVSSEYGSDPTRTHRPHYHLLFFFRDMIPFRLFRWAFNESTYNRKNGIRYFGIIKQCDVIDRLRGGIRIALEHTSQQHGDEDTHHNNRKARQYTYEACQALASGIFCLIF